MSDELKKLEQKNAQKRKNLAVWRASRRHELDLPSGLSVVVRDVDMTDILITGALPPSVLEVMSEAAETTDEVDLQELGVSMLGENAEGFNALLDAIAKATLIEPEIGEVADDDHITLAELPFGDKNAIMEWVNRGDAQVRTFREEEDESVEAV